jgi:hypothetical protein
MHKLNLRNNFRIVGNIVYIKLRNRNGLEKETLIDFDDFERVINSELHWHLKYEDDNNEWYAKATERYLGSDGKMHGRTVHLHQFIVGGCDCVDHKEHKQDGTLDNRKCNLRIATRADNEANRKGANKNSSTGARNVHLCKTYGGGYIYKVQIMRHGERYCWEYPLDQFEQAKEWAEKKREELFGEYKGNG